MSQTGRARSCGSYPAGTGLALEFHRRWGMPKVVKTSKGPRYVTKPYKKPRKKKKKLKT